MPSRINELRGRKKTPLSKNNRRGRSNTRRKTKKVSEKEIKEFMKKKIHNIIKFGSNMDDDKIIKELVKDGFKKCPRRRFKKCSFTKSHNKTTNLKSSADFGTDLGTSGNRFRIILA